MNFTEKDDIYFQLMSEMVNQSPNRYIIIRFDIQNPKKLVNDLKKEGLHTYKKKDYEKTLYAIGKDGDDVFKEKIGGKIRYFEQQDFKSSIPTLSYFLIEDIEDIEDRKEKVLNKENIISHELVYNHKETPHTFIIYENEDSAELKLSSPPEITPEKIKYDILSFYNFMKLKEVEINIDYFYKFLETPSNYLRTPFLPLFNQLVKDNLVAYHIITTFIEIDEFVDVFYKYKMIIANKEEYKSSVTHDLSEKLNGIEEIDGMTPEKIDICREKLEEIIDTLI